MTEKAIPEISAHTLTPDRAAADQHDLECDLCGHKWTAAPTNVSYRARKRGQTVGCPICNRTNYKAVANAHRKSTTSSVDNELAKIGFKLLEPYTNAHAKHLLRCVCCGHESNTTTLLSRKQMNKKWGYPGCRHCTEIQRQLFIDADVQTVHDLVEFENNRR